MIAEVGHAKSSARTRDTLLAVENVSKAFPGVQALDDVRFDLAAGEVHALLGENGAGKSTLIKILAGAQPPDTGRITLNGVQQSLACPADAEAAGIAVIYQEFNLVPAMTVVENLFLGRERTALGLVQRGAERAAARELFARMGVSIDPDSRCDTLSVAQQQIVEIAKALLLDARLIIMDEPTAALTDGEVERLFDIIRDLKQRHIAVIYVSHRLDEIFAICDRATVLRDGQYIDTQDITALSRQALIEMMVGRRLDNEFPMREPSVGDMVLEVDRLERHGVVEPCSFGIRRGEIVALTGLVGAGRTELARLIFGADVRSGGSMRLRGRPLDINCPRDAIAAGICMLTEDRKHQGLILNHAVRENFGLPNLDDFSAGGVVSNVRERTAFAGYVDSLRIKVANSEVRAANLSGGNQQKVVLAKWLQRHSEVLIFDEPTRGIDVGAKYEIYQLMNDLVAGGKAILMISSELPEVLGMADRVLVMRGGAIAGEIVQARTATQEDIMHLAVGGAQSTAESVEPQRTSSC